MSFSMLPRDTVAEVEEALHALVGEHLDEDAAPSEVAVGIETDRGPWVQALVAADYPVYAINPRQVARYRERHGNSGAKSDTEDSDTLADMVRRSPPAADGRWGQ